MDKKRILILRFMWELLSARWKYSGSELSAGNYDNYWLVEVTTEHVTFLLLIQVCFPPRKELLKMSVGGCIQIRPGGLGPNLTKARLEVTWGT